MLEEIEDIVKVRERGYGEKPFTRLGSERKDGLDRVVERCDLFSGNGLRIGSGKRGNKGVFEIHRPCMRMLHRVIFQRTVRKGHSPE